MGHLGRVLALTMVAVVPWFFGGVLPDVQVWLFVGTATALACAVAEAFLAGSERVGVPLAVLPLLAAILLGAAQLVPLDPGLLASLSPEAAAMRATLGAPAAEAESGAPARPPATAPAEKRPISLYPASTRHNLALLLLAAGVFCCGALLFRTSAPRMWLCGVLAVNGAALAFFGLVQALRWNGKIYWRYPLTEGGAPFGPFVCRNNAAGYLCLALAAAGGLLLWTFRRHTRWAVDPAGPTLPRSPQPWFVRLGRSVRQAVARLDGANMAALALGACIVAGILGSVSRGGWLAMAAAAVATPVAVYVVCRRAGRSWLFAPIALLGAGLILSTGMSERVRDRMATLADWETLSRNRLPHWHDSLGAVPDFWRAGSGLGTYRHVYQPYATYYSSVVFHHAENQYLEALIEGGVLGLVLLLAAIALVVRAACRLVRQPAHTRSFAFGLVGLFAVFSQVVHGFFDFGLYLPANMLTFALLCGAVCGRRAAGGNRYRNGFAAEVASGPAPLRSRALSAGVLGGLMVGMLAGLAWGGVQLQQFAVREAALARLPEPDPERAAESAARLDASLAKVDRALRDRADDAELHLAAARLRVGRYRLAALEGLEDSILRRAPHEMLWEMTSPGRLRARAHRLAAGGLEEELRQLRQRPLVRRYLVPAREHLLRARSACPLVGPVHFALAELAFLAEPPWHETAHVRRACRLAPVDADWWLAAGRFELRAGRRESAWDIWREGLEAATRNSGRETRAHQRLEEQIARTREVAGGRGKSSPPKPRHVDVLQQRRRAPAPAPDM